MLVAALVAVFCSIAWVQSSTIAQTQPGNTSGGPNPPNGAAGQISGGSSSNTGNGGWEPVANGPNCQGLTLASITSTTGENCNMSLVSHIDLHGQTAGEAFAMIIATGCTGLPTVQSHGQKTCKNGGQNGDRFMFVANEGTPDPIACFQIFDVQNPAAPIDILPLGPEGTSGSWGMPEEVGGYGNPNPPTNTDGSAVAPCTLISCTKDVTSLRCNSIDSTHNINAPNGLLVVAQEATKNGAGTLFYDISDPSNPHFLSYFNLAGPAGNSISHGTHHVWFFNGGNDVIQAGGAGMAGGASGPQNSGTARSGDLNGSYGPGVVSGCPGGTSTPQLLNLPAYSPKRASQDYENPTMVDSSWPACPREVARWYYPGTNSTDPLGVPGQMSGNDQGVRSHDSVIQPSRPDRAYLAMLDGGIVIMHLPAVDSGVLNARAGGGGAFLCNTTNVAFTNPTGSTLMCNNVWNPLTILAYRGTGFTHTVKPIISRNLIVDSEEALSNNCLDGPHRVSIWDVSTEALPRLLSVAPFAWDTGTSPPLSNTAGGGGTGLCGTIDNPGGRMGSHQPNRDQWGGPSWHNDGIVIDAEFRGGLRVFNIQNPFQVWEMAYYIPAYHSMGGLSTSGSEQLNDVYVDDRAYIYTNDRFGDGVWVLTTPTVNCNAPAVCHQ